MSWFFNRKAPQPVQTPVLAEESFQEKMFKHVNAVTATTLGKGDTLPIESTLLILDMVDDLSALLKHTQTATANIDEQIAIEFMLSDYIPSTIQAYLQSRGDQEKLNETFIKQLKLLSTRVDKMLDAVYTHDNAQLEINGRFLQEKFGN